VQWGGSQRGVANFLGNMIFAFLKSFIYGKLKGKDLILMRETNPNQNNEERKIEIS